MVAAASSGGAPAPTTWHATAAARGLTASTTTAAGPLAVVIARIPVVRPVRVAHGITSTIRGCEADPHREERVATAERIVDPGVAHERHTERGYN